MTERTEQSSPLLNTVAELMAAAHTTSRPAAAHLDVQGPRSPIVGAPAVTLETILVVCPRHVHALIEAIVILHHTAADLDPTHDACDEFLRKLGRDLVALQVALSSDREKGAADGS